MAVDETLGIREQVHWGKKYPWAKGATLVLALVGFGAGILTSRLIAWVLGGFFLVITLVLIAVPRLLPLEERGN